MGIISITSCQGLPMRDLIPLSTDEWLTNNWPMTDQYCAISYQFFWLKSLSLVILYCKSILVLLIYWFYEIFPSTVQTLYKGLKGTAKCCLLYQVDLIWGILKVSLSCTKILISVISNISINNCNRKIYRKYLVWKNISKDINLK